MARTLHSGLLVLSIHISHLEFAPQIQDVSME